MINLDHAKKAFDNYVNRYDLSIPHIHLKYVHSYKVMDGNSLRKVTTQVHYLKPIPYEEYKDMKKTELAELTKSRIQEAINEYAK